MTGLVRRGSNLVYAGGGLTTNEACCCTCTTPDLIAEINAMSSINGSMSIPLYSLSGSIPIAFVSFVDGRTNTEIRRFTLAPDYWELIGTDSWNYAKLATETITTPNPGSIDVNLTWNFDVASFRGLARITIVVNHNALGCYATVSALVYVQQNNRLCGEGTAEWYQLGSYWFTETLEYDNAGTLADISVPDHFSGSLFAAGRLQGRAGASTTVTIESIAELLTTFSIPVTLTTVIDATPYGWITGTGHETYYSPIIQETGHWPEYGNSSNAPGCDYSLSSPPPTVQFYNSQLNFTNVTGYPRIASTVITTSAPNYIYASHTRRYTYASPYTINSTLILT